MADPLNLLASGGVPGPAEETAGLNLLAAPPASPFKDGFGAGVAGVKSNLYGAGALVAHAVGADKLEQAALAKSAAAADEAGAQSRKIEDVDWTSPSSITNHFKFLIGNAIPSLATMAVGGVAGRGLGALAGAGAKAANLATIAGAVAPDVALEAGGIYPEALKTGIESPATRAVVGGAAAASLDFVPLLAAEKYLKAAGKAGFGAMAKGAAKGAPVGALLEGAQETMQSVVERAAAGQSLTDHEAISDYVNSFAGGAVPGAGFGAVIGGHRGMAPAAVQNQPAFTEREQPANVNVSPAAPDAAAPVADSPELQQVQPPLALVPDDKPLALVPKTTPLEDAHDLHNAIESSHSAAETTVETTKRKLASVTEELKLPDDQRRPKKEIVLEQRQLAAHLGDAETALKTLAPKLSGAREALKTQQVLAQTAAALNPEIKPSVAAPDSSVIQTKPPIDDTTAAETAVAQVKRSLGQLVSSREAKLAPVQTRREQALEIVNLRSGRKVDKAPDEKTRQGAVETAAIQAAQPAIDELTTAAGLPKSSKIVLTNALNKIAREAAAKGSVAEAQQHIGVEVPKALKGRVKSVDAAEVASTMINAVSEAHTLYSKGAVAPLPASEREQVAARAKEMFGNQPGLLKMADWITNKAGRRVNGIHTTGGEIGVSMEGPHPLMTMNHEGFHHAMRYHFTAHEQNVLLGEFKRGGEMASRVEQALIKDGLGDWVKKRQGHLYNKDDIGNEEIVAYGFQYWKNGDVQFNKPVTSAFKNLADFLARTASWLLDGGTTKFPKQVTAEDLFIKLDIGAFASRESVGALTTEQFAALPQAAKNAAVDFYDKAMADVGTALRQRLTDMIGHDPHLTVTTFAADTGSPIGTYTRTGKLKSLISMATNAKNGLSIADHEGFHYAEDRVLDSRERQVVRNAFAPGTRLFNQLVAQVQKYDLENKTHVADEILSIPAEARAYGFEFWKRGELQLEGLVATSFRKLQQFFEKISNYVKGLGFQSIEDVFTALDRGQFAERTKNQGEDALLHLRSDIAADPVLNSVGAVDALTDMQRRYANGELEREQSMNAVADLVDKARLSTITAKQAFGAAGEQFVGGLQRWRLKNIATGNYVSRFSTGYANVQKTLLAYVQRKSTLISRGSLEQLSSWHDNSTSQPDITAVGRVLLERTEKGLTADSTDYATMRASLSPHQQTMLDQATQMIADRLQHEFAVDQQAMLKILPGAEYQEWFEARQTQVQKLIEEGYVPERRYGDYTVHISLPSSDPNVRPLTLHYEQFENQAAADVRTQQYTEMLAREAPELKVESGYKYKVERDASISIQQFMDTARRNGINLTQQERERLAKALVSAESMRRNRLFRRKNIPGYSEDIMRVLHEFVVTTANKVAYSEFASPINDAIEGKPVDARTENGVPVSQTDESRDLWKEDGPKAGFFRNLSDELSDYVLVPDHGGTVSRKLRGAAMMYFIGGSLASGAVNAMSIPMNIVPFLSQSTGYANAVSKTFAAMRMTLANLKALRDIPTLKDRSHAIPAIDAIPGLRDALVIAAEDGRTMDTEIHQIMGMAQGASYSKSRKVQKAMDIWMAPFKLTEQVNRITAFIAAYRIGTENNLTGRQLYDFAGGTVDNTQNRYDEVNRPGLARNPVWAMLFMFKSFPMFMVEMVEGMARENPKSAVYFLLGLVAMTGVQGLPFAESIEDIIDVIAQRIFGSSFNSRRAMRNLIKDASEALTGADLSEVVLRGIVNDMTGMSIGSRVGMGDFVPGTRIGAADSDYGKVAEQILGAPISMAVSGFTALTPLLKGEFMEAIRAGGPAAFRNVIKGFEQMDRGYAQDAGGRKLVDVTGPEALWQMTGFSSAALNKAYELDKIDKQQLAFYVEMRKDFAHQMVKAAKDGNADKAQETMDAMQAWNAANPDMPIALSGATIRRDIMMAGVPLNARTLHMLPKQLRGTSVAAEGISR